MENALYNSYALVKYIETHLFASLTCSFSDTIQIMLKNRKCTFFMKQSLFFTFFTKIKINPKKLRKAVR